VASSQEKALSSSLKHNMQWVSEVLGGSEDLSIRQFRLRVVTSVEAAVLFIDGLVNTDLVQESIISSLIAGPSRLENLETGVPVIPKLIKPDYSKLLQLLKEDLLPVGAVELLTEKTIFLEKLMSGNVLILLDGHSGALAAELNGWKERTLSEPDSETVVRGPREGFTENIRTNTALVRRRIKSPNLRILQQNLKIKSGTKVSIAYLEGTALSHVIKEVEHRLSLIDIDILLESNQLEELIQEEGYSPFPTVNHTERPDVAASAIQEGRIAIFVDGTPIVLLVPSVFIQLFQSAEDYYQSWDIGSLIRLLRYASFFIAMLLPSIYIAITTFHQEMLPTILLISIASQREGVPFPAFIEALAMEITFEILREAGIRMPKTIGQTVSIVGTLVIGQAAVEAGIVSAAMVIVVSLTAISSFVLPSFNLSITVRMLRFIFMALAASFGIIGIAVGIIALCLHLCSLKSFTIPYMTTLAPYERSNQKDTLVRLPTWMMLTRPSLFTRRNPIRQSQVLKDIKMKPPRK